MLNQPNRKEKEKEKEKNEGASFLTIRKTNDDA
jgi:hypothetical protein